MEEKSYLERMEWQFGSGFPEDDDKCRYCGQDYGDHTGFSCPEVIPAEKQLVPA